MAYKLSLEKRLEISAGFHEAGLRERVNVLELWKQLLRMLEGKTEMIFGSMDELIQFLEEQDIRVLNEPFTLHITSDKEGFVHFDFGDARWVLLASFDEWFEDYGAEF